MSNIYKLAEQASEYAVLNPSDKVLQSETEDAKVEIPKAFIDKFAQSILQEVVELNRQELAFNAFERMLNKYKDHFGVEL